MVQHLVQQVLLLLMLQLILEMVEMEDFKLHLVQMDIMVVQEL